MLDGLNGLTIDGSYGGRVRKRRPGRPAGTSSFTTTKITRHLLTNIWTVEQFMDLRIKIEGLEAEVVVNCETQQEIDDLWDKLAEGGEEVQCGWLKDKYGVSWQIVPTVLGEMLQDKDTRRSESVMNVMLKMIKIDIEGLKKAYDEG